MVGPVRVSIRHYYSPRLLWTAQHHSELAGELEEALAGKTPFSIEHHGYVLSSIITSVAFLEAMINELFQDAADDHAPADGYVTPLSEECRRTMAEVWAITRGGRISALEKYDSLLRSARAPLLDRKSDIVKDAGAAIDLRNRLIHFRPEDRSVDDSHAMERIRGSSRITPLWPGLVTRGGRITCSETGPRSGLIGRSKRSPTMYQTRLESSRTIAGSRQADGSVRRRDVCEHPHPPRRAESPVRLPRTVVRSHVGHLRRRIQPHLLTCCPPQVQPRKHGPSTRHLR